MALKQRRLDMTMNDDSQNIWTNMGFIADEWTPYELLPSVEVEGKILLPIRALQEASVEEKRAFKGRLGAIVSADEPVDQLEDQIAFLALIALDFPKYSDGRSYSKAHLLRTKFGFTGEIRAVGDVLIDQVQFMMRTGFDSLAITNAPSLTQIKDGGGKPFHYAYQPDDAGSDHSATDMPQGHAYAWRRRLA